MRQAKLVGTKSIALEEAARPEPGPGDVLIRVAVCSICGSDLHAYRGRHPFVHPPRVMGHEFAGTVAAVGPGVTDVAEGDRVTVEPNVACGHCYNCRHGRYNICRELGVIGCVGYEGGMAEYALAPAPQVIQLPESIPFDQASMIEPTAVAVHAVRRAEQKAGNRVVVLGAGTIGLLVMLVAKVAGADQVAVTDLMPHRLALAEKWGADLTINPSTEALEQVLIDAWGVDGVDLVYECVGVQNTVAQGMSVARKGTRIMIVGVPHQPMTLHMELVQDRELELVGSLMYVREDFLGAMRLVDQGRVQVKPFITHRFSLEQVGEAFEFIEAHPQDVLKVLVEVQ